MIRPDPERYVYDRACSPLGGMIGLGQHVERILAELHACGGPAAIRIPHVSAASHSTACERTGSEWCREWRAEWCSEEQQPVQQQQQLSSNSQFRSHNWGQQQQRADRDGL